MLRRLTLALLLFLIGTTSTYAQEEDAFVRIKFRTLPVLSADWTGIFYQAKPEGGMAEVDFRSLSRSFFTYDYHGPKTLRFYREDGLDEDGEMRYRTIAAVDISAEESLVFFKPNPADRESEFTLLAIDDSPRGLPTDHIAFINFTPVDFACRFIKDDMMLPPGLTGPISIENALEEDLFIGLAVTNEKTHRIVLKNRWEFQGGNRHLILLLPPKKSGSFRIRAYRVTEFVGESQRFNPNWTPPEIIEQTGVTKM